MGEQLNAAELLVKFGFIKPEFRYLYDQDPVKKGDKFKTYSLKEKKPEEKGVNKAHADEEYDEEVNLSAGNTYLPTGWPKPKKRHRMVHESFNMGLEELYFWSLNHLRQDWGYHNVIKVTDTFSASENSAFFGQSAQRLSIQEDRASSFMRGISELVKTLFQIVRELRIIDERLDVYKEWRKSKSADATLKGFFADFAENKGSQMQPGSIYHLANSVGYAVLPDLFFNTVVYNKEDVDKVVDKLEFNPNVKAVLKRKLYQYVIWVEKTEKELYSRRRFQIKYLRQHYLTIKMYMSWVKPYLKHIRRLTMSEEQLDSPFLISSFETSATEVEVLAYQSKKEGKPCPCVLMTYYFTTRPILQYSQEYNRGPVHVGRGIWTLRAYGWTKDQIQQYVAMKDREDRELLGLVDDELKSAMEMLGDDLEKYLKEAESTLDDEKKSDVPSAKEVLKPVASNNTVFDPFVSMFKGVGEIGKAFSPAGFFKSSDSGAVKASASEAASAADAAAKGMWAVYKNYKKAHGLLSW
ncbi:MAG: hypothetical protein ACP5N2_05720 [Candidatus Nanoarchaeia archaeon]